MMLVCPTCGRSFEGRFCPVDGAPLAPARRDTFEGAVIGDTFQVEGVLGRGMGGTVYAATQLDLARPVALKVLNADLARSAKNVARFEREARALARLEHPGVVAVYAIGRTPDDRPFLAMERADGVPLEDVLGAPLPVARAITIARRIAVALGAVHAAGLVHRDLKPSNVMIASGDRVKLLDFGVVKLDDATKLTAGGEALGTPHYMAPEQATGEACDARTDLYALGAILFRMLTGAVPFEGSGMQVMMAHVGRPAPRPSERVPGLGGDVDALVARCLAKRPAERFASAAELVAALDELARTHGRRLTTRAFEATVPAAPPGPRLETDVRALLPPRPIARAALVAAIALVIAGLGWGVWRAHRPIATRLAVAVRAVAPALTDEAPRGALVFTGPGYALRVAVPARLVSGRSAELTLELWDGDGAPLAGADTVVTVTAPSGAVTGLPPTAPRPGVLHVRVRFAEPGTHVLRVFLPIGDATIAIPLEVARGPSAQA